MVTLKRVYILPLTIFTKNIILQSLINELGNLKLKFMLPSIQESGFWIGLHTKTFHECLLITVIVIAKST
jgi:hypothetical protein